VVSVTAHDFYLRDLAANPATGEYLLVQLAPQGETVSPVKAFATRLGSDGSAKAVAAWTVTRPAQQVAFDRVRAAYDPTTRGYRVAWLLAGRTGSVIASRAVDANARELSATRPIAETGVLDNPQFNFAAAAYSGEFMTIWISPVSPTKLELLAQRIDQSGRPLGTTITASDAVDPPELRDHRPQVTAAHNHYVVWWRNTFNIRLTDQGDAASASGSISLPNDPTGAVTSAIDPVGQRIAILSLSDNPGGGNQIFARVLPLPH
jgi:hypothetical protein